MDLKWLFSNQILFLYAFSLLTFSSLFGFLWAVVLLISIELIENNFEFDINVADELDKGDLKETTTTVYLRNYSLNQDFQESNHHKEIMNRENERKPSGMMFI